MLTKLDRLIFGKYLAQTTYILYMCTSVKMHNAPPPGGVVIHTFISSRR